MGVRWVLGGCLGNTPPAQDTFVQRCFRRFRGVLGCFCDDGVFFEKSGPYLSGLRYAPFMPTVCTFQDASPYPCGRSFRTSVWFVSDERIVHRGWMCGPLRIDDRSVADEVSHIPRMLTMKIQFYMETIR